MKKTLLMEGAFADRIRQHGAQHQQLRNHAKYSEHVQLNISEKQFRPGAVALSKWKRSVRAVRETPVADYSAPSFKTTHRNTYHPPIAISLFLLGLSVSYFKQTLWHCGQLWPYVGMGSFGTRLHQDCNAMCDTAKISPRVPSTLSSRRMGRWEDMMLPGHENPRNLGQSEWDQKLGKIECEFSLYDEKRWKWDDVYLLRGLPNIYSLSLCPPLLPLYPCTTAVATWSCTWSSVFQLHLEMEIQWAQRFTWRSWSRQFGDALGGHERVNLQAIIERVWRCTWKAWSSAFGDALGGWDRVNSEDALGGRDRSSLEMYSEAVTERVGRCTCRLWSSGIGGVLGGGRFAGRRDGSWDSIHWVTCNCGNVESWVQHPPRDEKLAGSGRLSILGWCCTWCMLYSVLTHDYGMER